MTTLVNMYAIYDHPTDFPNHWVVRGWRVEQVDELFVEQPDAEAILCASVEEARTRVQEIMPDAVLISNNESDPHLSEVWM